MCRCTNDTADYRTMQEALIATGREIFHSMEGSPNISMVSGRPADYGGTHRSGHDVMATWFSMLSEIDLASGLHPFVHADEGHGSFFNDLDMLEIGNPFDKMLARFILGVRFAGEHQLQRTIRIVY